MCDQQDSKSDATPSSSSFTLKSGESSSETFNSRHKDVFAFDEIKIKHVADESTIDPSPDSAAMAKPVNAQDFKGRESLFRVPENEWKKPDREGGTRVDKFSAFRDRKGESFRKPYDRPRGGGGAAGVRAPGFKKNPEKYTKYSLEDVDVMNSQQNSRAAFAFLRELDGRKASDEEEVRPAEGEKIAFRKPTKRPARKDDDETADVSCSSEEKTEVVAQKAVKKRSQMTLSHLQDDEEEDF